MVSCTLRYFFHGAAFIVGKLCKKYGTGIAHPLSESESFFVGPARFFEGVDPYRYWFRITAGLFFKLKNYTIFEIIDTGSVVYGISSCPLMEKGVGTGSTL
jgi:hypothetical protein